MATLTPPRADTGTGPSRHRPFGLLKDLERPGDMFRDLGPNWYATVMGTGIVAVAAALLTVRVTGLHAAALAVWALAACCLIALTAAWAVHWIKYPDRARAHAANPVMAPFWGAPAMALMTVGAGTVLLGRDWIGLPIASVIIITVLWSRLVTYRPGPAVMMPTMWIVLGPLGQSVTAAGNLAGVAGTALPRPYPAGTAVFALLYGVPAWGFAMLWLALATAITVRTARQGLPFGLTWWSFTFPVGTCVTGTISLAVRTHSEALRGASVVLFALLAAAWLLVAARTAAGSARGRLFLPTTSPAVTSGGDAHAI